MAFIRRNPTLSFFLLTFGVTWLAWTPYLLSSDGIGLLPHRFPVLLGSSQTLGVLPGAYLGPITAAFLVTAVADGRPGLRIWGARLVRWRVGVRWYAAVVLGVPALIVLATFALPGAWGDVHLPPLSIIAGYLPFLLLQSVTTGLAEEPGWRDFALPRLQDRYGPLAGTLLLGTLWGAWHVPLFCTAWGGWPDVHWLTVAEFVAGAVLLSIPMTWVFNRTGESLPVVVLLHAGVNAMYSLAWPAIFPSLDAFRDSLHVQLLASALVAVPLLIGTRGRLGCRPAAAVPVPAVAVSR